MLTLVQCLWLSPATMGVLSFLLAPVKELLFLIYWIGWLFSSITLASGHTFLVLYTVLRITLSLLLFIAILVLRKLQQSYRHLLASIQLLTLSHDSASSLPALYHRLRHATNWESYLQTALLIDQLTGAEQWKLQHASRAYDYLMLEVQVASLIHARTRGDHRALLSLQSVLYRHFCSIENEQLYTQSEVGTKHLIEEYYARVVEQLSYLATLADDSSGLSARAKLRFFQRARKSYGRTALCLSGTGRGALAMYHVGVVKALVAGNCLPSIVAGTSGGSIVAGLLAISTDAELADPELLSNTISSKYGCRWLPPLGTQFRTFMRERVLLDSRVFTHTCQQYYKSFTFEEAHRRTGRDVSITVSYASKQGSTLRSHALTLNHITSPNVLIWSAVVTSCALPGLMHPQTLYAKSHTGNIKSKTHTVHFSAPQQSLTLLLCCFYL